jgi:PTH1 family peptidyl-tRNA hydrolase
MTTMIAGLGNPGEEYSGTRHNIGFLVVDALAETLSLSWNKKKSLEGWIARGKTDGGEEVILLKPATFMNASGRCIARTLRYFDLAPASLIVVMDDMDLDFGKVRMRLRGSAGGHRGLASIDRALGGAPYRRVRLGIANERLRGLRHYKSRKGITDFELSRFSREESRNLDAYLDLGVKGVFELIRRPAPGTLVLDAPPSEPRAGRGMERVLSWFRAFKPKTSKSDRKPGRFAQAKERGKE